MRYLTEIKDGETVVEHYLCKQKQTLKSRSNKNYLSLKLQDKTGILEGKVWDLNKEIQSFDEGDFIKIDGTAQVYQNEIQLNIKRIRKSMEGEFDPADYIPSTEKNVDEMLERIKIILSEIKKPHYKKLLENIIFNDEKTSISFKTHSAAKAVHHAYMGGLLEHSLGVAEICLFLSEKYPTADKDLLLTSALLHDIGKIFELSPFPTNEYTDIGQLIGHINIGVEFVDYEAKKIPSFPETHLILLKHSLLSHHGEYEFGSPVLPKTLEAFLLHFADNIDAKARIFEEVISEDQTQGLWVGYNKMLGRNIRKTNME